ncbi:LysR family transcriptional regulator [Amycolatopsis thermoflava]|uniref:LysR family transcriptional regulator n=1 Tax=Amycolatopsis thermoflava TaxID=84480 RepID=UPI00381423B4
MEFRHLVSFLAIADELHFGRAAARLHLTQPSLSQQLQRLERTLGVELVARTSHEVRLTSAGRAFEVEARAIVNRMGKAAQSAREAAAGRTGTISVGYNFPAGQHILPATLARMHAEYPDIPGNLPVPGGFRRLLRDRFAAANAVLAEVTRETRTLCLDLAGRPEWNGPGLWSPDGLHPSPEGHRAFADAVADLVTEATGLTKAA